MALDLVGLVGVENNTLLLGAYICMVLALTLVAAKVVSKLLIRSFSKISRNIKVDETQFVILRRLTVLLVYIVGIAIAGSMVPGLSTVGISVLASAGVIAVVLGFAAQQAFSNVISGVFLAVFRPFRVGDKISIKDEYGTIEDITLRHTVIKTWDEKRVIIPNSRISEEYITNYSIKNPHMLGTLDICISYDSDIEKAREIMTEESLKHPNFLKKIHGSDNEFLSGDEQVKVSLIELTDSAQKLRLYYWGRDKTTAMKMKYDLLESIKKRFDREGIEIPYPHLTVLQKNKGKT